MARPARRERELQRALANAKAKARACSCCSSSSCERTSMACPWPSCSRTLAPREKWCPPPKPFSLGLPTMPCHAHYPCPCPCIPIIACHAMPFHSTHLRPLYMDTVESFAHIWTPLISKYGSSNRRKPGMGTFFGAKFKIVRWWGFFYSGVDYPRWTHALLNMCG